MLEGRAAEQAALRSLLAEAVAGGGGTIWIVGEPGMGKTALLDALAADAPDDVLVLRTIGREAEADLAWAALATVIGPLVERGDADALPEIQQRALRTALALEVPEGTFEPFATILAARGTLAAAAARHPVMILVDDAQWLDRSSLAAISFLASRGPGGGVALVVTSRPIPTAAPPVPVLTLAPLSSEAADALLVCQGVTSREVRRRVIADLGGNPLLLVSAAQALDIDQREGRSPPPLVLPIPPSVLDLAAARLSGVPPKTRTAMLVAAAAGDAEPSVVARALDGMGLTTAALETAERVGLVEIAAGTVLFTHPTIRSAAYHSVAAADRRAAHAAVGAATAEPAARAWHRGLATLGVDATVADELDRSGKTLLDRGAPAEAGRHLELAARLTPDPTTAAVRLRRAAAAVIEFGHDDAAQALLDRADRTSDDPLETVQRRRLRLLLALRGGAVDEPIAALRTLADEVVDRDPGLSAEILVDVMGPLVRLVRALDLLDVAEAARARAHTAGDERIARRAEVAVGIARIATGDPTGHPLLARYQEVLDDEGSRSAGAFLAEVVAPCLAMLQRTPEAEALFTSLASDLRAQGALPSLVTVLGTQAIAVHGSSLSRAADLGREAVDLADAIGHPTLGLLPASSLVIAAAVIGDRATCTSAAERLLSSEEPAMVQAALAGLGALHLGLGEIEAALAWYDQLVDRCGVGTGVLRWEAEWCEALVRSRRLDDARQALAASAAADPAASASGGLARVQILLAEDLDEAGHHFEDALAYFRLVGNRVGEGRTELVWGERLRRARRRAAARTHLEQAANLLRDVGATVWAERATLELSTSGGGVPGETGVESLTALELTIARLAATGASNQEIGEEVFLSPRTVETHLSACFRKLGIRNRRELAGLATREPRLLPVHPVRPPRP